jgi:aromatic ring-opening dioxygenase LigB subunit
VYADVVNLLGENIDTTNKNTETLTDTSKEVGLEVNTEKSKHMLISPHQIAGQNHNIVTCTLRLASEATREITW